MQSGFWSVPKLITLSNFEHPIGYRYTLLCTKWQLSEPTTSNSLQLEQYCQMTKMQPASLVFGNTWFMGQAACYLCGSRASCYTSAVNNHRVVCMWQTWYIQSFNNVAGRCTPTFQFQYGDHADWKQEVRCVAVHVACSYTFAIACNSFALHCKCKSCPCVT